MPRAREVLVCVNRSSGTAARSEREADEIRAALASAGIKGRVELLDGAAIAEQAKKAAEAVTELIVVGGGDGTISAAAGALAGTETSLGILPLGTLNHFARDLGIPMKLDEAAKVIAAGQTRVVDVAEVNGRTFINNSAIGLYPLMVIDRDLQQQRLGRSKRFAMVVAALRTLARFHHNRLTLTVNDEQARLDTPLLFVGNNDYRIDIGAPGHRGSLQDGKLCVLVMRKKTRRGLIAASIRALLNRTRPDDMVRLDDVARLRVASRRTHLPISVDGEVTALTSPLDYKVRKRALKVIAP
ncbi:diacylglycerol kinase family lipid kinase [Sphingomonas sediminicola]|uniref:Diacylglycerol kinase family lipid kinase n=1 Tax=Sphingomonas sediminicola TaxID=386874 RepID=A0ABX6T5T1_9SPHN|nr:diacylglycerol kinase family protein [Sphingomonas sediminicola]QNP45236.1 diacylglycerol kinase family lipid kinase [Sphingomonas sediminicola]